MVNLLLFQVENLACAVSQMNLIWCFSCNSLTYFIYYFVIICEQDVESYDPILNPVLNRELRRTGGRVLITIGDQDIDLSPSFTIFLSTRDPTVRHKTSPCLNSGLHVPHDRITGSKIFHVKEADASCLSPAELNEPAVLAAALLSNVTCGSDFKRTLTIS